LQWMKVAKSATPATLVTYRQDAKVFLLWLGERGVNDLRDVTAPLVERYQLALYEMRARTGPRRGERVSTQTQLRRLSIVSTWFKYLLRHRVITQNPAALIELPRTAERLPAKPFSVEEAELVLAQPEIGTAKGLRDRAMLEVLFATAIRRAELMQLRFGDIDASRGTLFVYAGKGNKQRIVPISERALYWVEQYVVKVRSTLKITSGVNRLFLTLRGCAMTHDAMSEAVSPYIKQAGVRKGGSCHLFRHTVATLMLEGGADLRYVQEMLGHESPATTQIYTRVSITSLQAVYEKSHPATTSPLKRNAAVATDDDAKI